MLAKTQVTSPEASKALVKSGFKPSFRPQYFWIEDSRNIKRKDGTIKPVLVSYKYWERMMSRYIKSWPAYTVADLGEISPEYCTAIKRDGRWLPVEHIGNYQYAPMELGIFEREADARAKIVIHLKIKH